MNKKEKNVQTLGLKNYKLYASKFENLDEIGIFLDKCNLSKVTQEETDYFNRHKIHF